MTDRVQVQLFGEIDVAVGGESLPLPKSKKTRALLAYLIVTGRPQRRQHLCGLFWETSADPKGALRWSLSQIRKFQKELGIDLIDTDRERARAIISNIETDLSTVLTSMDDTNANVATLESHLKILGDWFIPELDLPNLHSYSAWLTAERDRLTDIQIALMSRLISRTSLSVNQKIKYAKAWLNLRPFDTSAAAALLSLLKDTNRLTEFATWTQSLSDRFEQAGLEFDPKAYKNAASLDPLSEDERMLLKQQIKFCKTENGLTLAYASVGEGPPLIKAANWLSHLELDWSAPIWSPLFKDLARDFQFIRYDERGNGLSDWKVGKLTQTEFVKDLATIIKQFNFDKVPLLGISQGVAVCIDYTVANPDRVSKLVLFGGYPKGWRVDATPEVTTVREAMMTLTRDGWGKENPAYRNIFSSTFMPTATPEQLDWFNDFQRRTTSPENAVRFLEAFADIDVQDKLSRINVPTLVIHSRGDQRIEWTVGRDMAAQIPNAEFVTLESKNHLLLEGEPAAQYFIEAVREFLLD